MKIIPDIIWGLFWAIPFFILGFICQHIQFIFWSAKVEFKRGQTSALKHRVESNRSKGGE